MAILHGKQSKQFSFGLCCHRSLVQQSERKPKILDISCFLFLWTQIYLWWLILINTREHSIKHNKTICTVLNMLSMLAAMFATNGTICRREDLKSSGSIPYKQCAHITVKEVFLPVNYLRRVHIFTNYEPIHYFHNNNHKIVFNNTENKTHAKEEA